MMQDCAICILTRGRWDKQVTLNNLPPKIREQVWLVVDEDEVVKYMKYSDKVKAILVMPRKHKRHNWDGNFSDKKEYTAHEMVKEGHTYMMLLDDDMYFCSRKNGKLGKATMLETRRIFKVLYDYMHNHDYAHVALSPREGNNRVEAYAVDNTRAYRFCGFNLETVLGENLSFNRTQLMADFDITLQLLERGYPNRVLYEYANGTAGSNMKGGCSLYRSPETMASAAHHLHSLHPLVVKVEDKQTSKPWAGFETNVRTDVTVFWKKAFTIGKGKKNGISKFLKRDI